MDVSGKRCSTCHEVRPLAAYNRRRSAPDGLQARCRECCRAWYVEHAGPHQLDVRRRNDRARVELRDRLVEHLLSHPCVDCGERDLRLLELDHLDPLTKRDGVGRLVAQAMSWAVVAREIAKCDVRCAACHRLRTQEVAGSWRNAVEEERQREREQASARLRRVLPGD